MKALLTLILLAAAPLVSAETPSSMAGQDPLMRQILHRQLTQNNGGVTAAVRIATGQSIELHVNEPITGVSDLKDAPISAKLAAGGDPLASLKPAAGLMATATETPTSKKDIKKANEQLKTLQGKGHSKWQTR